MTNDMPEMPPSRPAATRRIPIAIGAVVAVGVIGLGAFYGLGYFADSKAKVFQDLKSIGKALGMPTSVLVDGKGCEIANLAGPAEWASDDAIRLIKAAMEPAKAGS